jgi:hypothetical protein
MQGGDFAFRQLGLALGWHVQVIVFGQKQVAEQVAFVRVSSQQYGSIFPAFADRSFAVQAQATFHFIGSMTGVALVFEDRRGHIAVQKSTTFDGFYFGICLGGSIFSGCSYWSLVEIHAIQIGHFYRCCFAFFTGKKIIFTVGEAAAKMASHAQHNHGNRKQSCPKFGQNISQAPQNRTGDARPLVFEHHVGVVLPGLGQNPARHTSHCR